jgi:hypothetical protein
MVPTPAARKPDDPQVRLSSLSALERLFTLYSRRLRSYLPTSGLGFVLCCKDHIRAEATCAVCLREGSQVNASSPYEPVVIENEDEHPTFKMNPNPGLSAGAAALALGWCGSEMLGLAGWCPVGSKHEGAQLANGAAFWR